ncbi:MAG: biopolymer transporter ExbD [Chromatiaceae bacterium]|nr:MAG: biopolymer transporter ExbD [Chromatiaceae bacterium]
MRLPRPQPRPRSEDHLIPLINVVFLMLIFFMVAGQLGVPDPFEVAPPTARDDAALLPAPVELLLAADGRLALAGELVSGDRLEDALLRAGVAAAALEADPPAGPGSSAGPDAPPPIVLKADAGVTAALLRETLERLRLAGLTELGLLTAPAD